MFESGATFLSADCCFSELELLKQTYNRIGSSTKLLSSSH
jgi:hypothetical protein